MPPLGYYLLRVLTAGRDKKASAQEILRNSHVPNHIYVMASECVQEII